VVICLGHMAQLMVLPSWYWLTWVDLDEEPLNGCSGAVCGYSWINGYFPKVLLGKV